MRMRLGMAMGFGLGYLMGTKAGRERYDQMKLWAGEMMGSPQLDKLREEAVQTFERAAAKLPDPVQEHLPEAMRVRKIPEPILAAPQEPFSAPADGTI